MFIWFHFKIIWLSFYLFRNKNQLKLFKSKHSNYYIVWKVSFQYGWNVQRILNNHRVSCIPIVLILSKYVPYLMLDVLNSKRSMKWTIQKNERQKIQQQINLNSKIMKSTIECTKWHTAITFNSNRSANIPVPTHLLSSALSLSFVLLIWVFATMQYSLDMRTNIKQHGACKSAWNQRKKKWSWFWNNSGEHSTVC